MEVEEDSRRKSSSQRHKIKKDQYSRRLWSSPEQEWMESSVFQCQEGADVHHYNGADVQHRKDTSGSMKREEWTESMPSSWRNSSRVLSTDLRIDSSQDVSFRQC